MTINQFFKECNDRAVFKLLSIYIVSSWVILQVLVAIWSPLGIPEISVTYLIIALLIGFPVYIYYLWRTKSHLILTDPDDMEQEEAVLIRKRKQFKAMYFKSLGIISVMSLVAVGFIIKTSLIGGTTIPEFSASDKIAVLDFRNNTGDTNYDQIGTMTMNWIRHSITENKVGQVITQDVLSNYTEAIESNFQGIASDRDILQNYLKPSKIVEGFYILKDGVLILSASIIEGNSGNTLYSIKPVECESDSPWDCIEELNQLILGFFISEKTDRRRIDPTPPKYEAYKLFMEAQEIYGIDNKLYLDLLNRAIEIDSNYFEALVNKVMFYVNRNDFKTADSLRLTILPRTGHTDRMKNLMNYYQATIEGNNRRIYDTHLREYEINSFSIRTNQTQMTLALQAVYKPELVESFYNELPNDDFDIQSCTFCMYRVYTKAVADIELGNYFKALDLLEKAMVSNDHVLLKKAAVAAYIRTENYEMLYTMLDQVKLLADQKVWEECNLLAGKEVLLKSNDFELANKFFQNVISGSEQKNSRNIANAYYYLRDFEKAEELYNELLTDDPKSLNHLAKLAVSYYQNGNPEACNEVISRIEELRTDYDLGFVDYALAQIYASCSDMEKALDYLRNSIANGRWYTQETFKNDFHFRPVIGGLEFNEIMNFWNKGL